MNETLQRSFKPLALLLLWLLSLGAAAFLARRPAPVAVEIVPPPTATHTPVPTATLTPAPLRIYVSGAVARPDVYTLDPGAIVRDAVAAAGGFGPQANRDALNLATELYDGAQVHVPAAEEAATQPPPGISGAPPAGPTAAGPPSVRGEAAGAKININAARAEELESLPGVGPALAQRIVEGRPYQSPADLKQVKGIGEATFAKLEPLISVR